MDDAGDRRGSAPSSLQGRTRKTDIKMRMVSEICQCGGRCGQKTGGERGEGQTLGRVNQQGSGREGLGGFQRCSDRRDTVTGEAGADVEVVLM